MDTWMLDAELMGVFAYFHFFFLLTQNKKRTQISLISQEFQGGGHTPSLLSCSWLEAHSCCIGSTPQFPAEGLPACASEKGPLPPLPQVPPWPSLSAARPLSSDSPLPILGLQAHTHRQTCSQMHTGAMQMHMHTHAHRSSVEDACKTTPKKATWNGTSMGPAPLAPCTSVYIHCMGSFAKAAPHFSAGTPSIQSHLRELAACATMRLNMKPQERSQPGGAGGTDANTSFNVFRLYFTVIDTHTDWS